MTLPLTSSDYSTLNQILRIPPLHLLQHMDQQRASKGPAWLLSYMRTSVDYHAEMLLQLLDTQRHNPDWIQYQTESPTWNIDDPSDIQTHYTHIANLHYTRTLQYWLRYNPPPLTNLQRCER
jgi:hypothetical protein